MNFKPLLTLIICLVSLSVYAQDASTSSNQNAKSYQDEFDKTGLTKENIIVSQKEMNKLLLGSFSNEKVKSSVSDLIKIKIRSKERIREWYNNSIDLLAPDYKDQDMKDLDSVRGLMEAESERQYMKAIEVMYAKNKVNHDLRVFPAFTAYMAMLYNNSEREINFFQNTTLNFGDDNASFKNEIVSGYLWAIKTTLSTVLTRSEQKQLSADKLEGLTDPQLESTLKAIEDENKANSTFTKIISGGGEANLDFKFPIFNFFGNEKSIPKLRSDIKYRLSADLPVAGSSIDKKDINLFNVFSLETKLIIPFMSFNTVKKEGVESFSAFVKYDINNIGGTAAFYNTLQINKDRFWYGEYSGGLIYKNFLFYYTNQKANKAALHGMNKGRLAVALVKQF